MSDDEMNIELEAQLERIRARLHAESATDNTVIRSADLSAASPGFAAGFAGRVMTRLDREASTPSLGDGLERVFRRLAPIAAAAVFLVGSLNLFSSRAERLSVTERVLGLPAVTVASALAVDAALSDWSR